MNIRKATIALLVTASALAQPRAEANRWKPSARVWLATVAVQDYDHLPASGQLNYCINDEQVLVDRMREGNRIAESQIRRFRKGSTSRRAPTARNIMRELPEFLSNAGPEDSVVLFMSMHGMSLTHPTTAQTETFLIPQDFDPQNPAETLINVRWLRNLLFRDVKAGRIMLLIDACHSGGLGTGAVQPLMASRSEMFSTRDFRTMMEETQQELSDRSIYVITSCSDAETSLEAHDIRHGLFTHWLIQGMDGAADGNDDAMITMDELFGFVEHQVPASARYYQMNSESPVSQHPQRFMLGTNHGDVPVMSLLPQPPATAIDRLADSVHALVRHGLMQIRTEGKRTPVVGLVELTPEYSNGPADTRFGTFPVVLQRELEDRLFSRKAELSPTSRYNIMRFDEIRRANRDITRVDLSEGYVNSGTIDAVICGRFVHAGVAGSTDNPERICLNLVIRDVRQGCRLYQINSSILITPQYYAMFGVSGDIQQPPAPPQPSAPAVADNQQPSVTETSPTGSDLQTTAIIPAPPAGEGHAATATPGSATIHPLRDQENSTLQVEVWQSRPGRTPVRSSWLPPDASQPNLLCFETSTGNEIQLRLRNQTDDQLAVIVQIDGMNIIGKTICVPEKARYWSISPRKAWQHDRWLDGLKASANGSTANSTGGKFVVVSPPESVAGRMNVTDDLGEIRILVYGTRVIPPGARAAVSENSLGIGEGSQKVNQKFELDRSNKLNLDDLRAQYVIRYVKAGSQQKPVTSQDLLTSN